MDPTNQPIPHRHRHGDSDAFGTLVRNHAGMVFATARRVTGNAALAEDVAQETFLELAHSREDAMESVSAWLHRVAWRKACNAVRSESRRRRHEQAAVAVTDEGNECDAAWHGLEPLIDEELEGMPAHQRELLVEHYLQGRTQQELADGSGVNQSTISRQLESAIRELRSRLQARGVLCGASLGAVLAARAAEAAPASLTVSLGKLATSGVGAHASLQMTATIASSIFAMTTTQITCAIAVAAALIAVPFVVRQQGTIRPKPDPVVTANPVPKAAVAQTPESAAKPRHYRPTPVSLTDQQTVEAIIRRHKGMTQDQLLKSKELSELMEGSMALLSTPEMALKIQQAVEDIKLVTGAQHGSLDIGFEALDGPQGRAWLEAAVSGDAGRLEAWMLNRLNGSIFEFAMDPNLKKTSGGVSVTPAKPSPPIVDTANE